MSIITPNLMKKTLQDGGSVIGTMISEIRQPAVIQLLKNAGFDFVIIDNEHGPFNIETIADLSRMAKALGITPIVRVTDLTYFHIAQTMDAGAQGIMLPRVTHADQAREAVQMMKYAPLGRRGCALARGHTEFQSGPLPDTLEALNNESFLIIQVETAEAVENIEEIVAVPGVDTALIGPTDLSLALGVAAQWESPTLHAAIEKTIASCQTNDIYSAIHFNDVEWATYWHNKGMRISTTFSVAGSRMRGVQAATSAIGEAMVP